MQSIVYFAPLLDAFKSKLDLQLVGPYDILAGKTKAKNSRGKRPCYLRHWRYYYDPPEFLTILRGNDKSQFHMGYFRFVLHAFVCIGSYRATCKVVV